jgi:AraC family transcriptional regulator
MNYQQLVIRPIQSFRKDSDRLPRLAQDAANRAQLRTNTLLTVVPGIIETLAGALSKDLEATRQCVRHASATLLSCVRDADQSLGAKLANANKRIDYRGGLAPWQARTLTRYIDANLGASLSCETMARLAKLSVSHLSRAFKCTFGYSPHEFLVRRRLQRSQDLMLQTDAPLAQIALECGFADQAHLSRAFRRITGERPSSWRRARWDGDLDMHNQ